MQTNTSLFGSQFDSIPKLNEGIKNILSVYFDIPLRKTSFVSSEIADYITKLEEKIKEKNIIIVSGKGTRPPQIVKDYHNLTKMLIKTLEYEEKENICGPDKKSYFKTDHDATAMCLKQDYYSGVGSNMHAAYSVQILVSKGLILDYFVSQETTDFKTFIPFLKDFFDLYVSSKKNLC